MNWYLYGDQSRKRLENGQGRWAGFQRLLGIALLWATTLFAPAHSHAQCSIAVPTGTDGCNYGSGRVTLSAAGSTGYYAWFNDSTGVVPVGFESSFTTPVLTTSQTYYLAATDTGVGITLDGTNDIAAIDNLTYSGTGHTQLTVEAWIKTTSGADQVIASFDRSEFWRLEINGSGAGFGQVGFDLNTDAGILDFGSNSRVDDGQWHHVAAVYDNGTASIYIDGVLDVTTTRGTSFGKPSTTRYGFIGVGSETSSFNGSTGPNSYYNGQMDDLRIWNTARSAADIANSRFACLTGTETGLVAYYKMDEGNGGTLADSSATGATATLFNADLNAVWAQPGIPVCACQSTRIPVTASIAPNNFQDRKFTCAAQTFTLDAGPGHNSYLWNTGATTQTLSAVRSGIYTVTVTGGACSGSDTMSIVGKRDADRLLRFDGVNDYVAIEDFTYEESQTEFTVETWVRTSNSGDQILASYDRSEYWRLEINGEGGGPGQIGFDVRTNAGIVDFGSTRRVDDGEWHHVAGVFNNGQISIYIDGILDADTTVGISFGTGVTRYGFLGTGSEAPTFNGARGPDNRLNGRLDELRIWSVARTVSQIRASMTVHVPGNEPGLETYLKFDDPPGTKVFDYSTQRSNDGRLFNFDNLGRPPSGAPIGDQSMILYTNSWAGQTVSVNSCEGEILTVSNMSGSPDGVHVYFVNRPPDSTGGVNGIGSNDRYFGVHKIGDDTATYTATYNYAGNPHVSALPEQNIRLFTRMDNSIANWSSSAATPDTTANTFVATAQFTEFILGSISGTTLPIELLSFEAQPEENREVHLEWVTAAEINNDFFTIERSLNATDWTEIVQIPGAGNSNSERSYFEVDEEPPTGLLYYRLKQTDFDGQFSYSPVRAIRIAGGESTEVSVFPNPTNGMVTIRSQELEAGSVRLFSALGVEVTNQVQFFQQGQHEVVTNLDRLTPGLYILKVGQTTTRVQKQ